MGRICPLLALAADGRSVVDGVDPTHRCHAETPSLSLDRRQQATVCLTEAHVRCDRYLAHAARQARARPRPIVVGDGLVSTRLVIAPEPTWRGMAGRARRWNVPRLAAAGAGVALVAAAGAAVVGSGILDEGGGSAREGTSAGVASRAPSPSPTQTPRPTTSPTPSPTPVPTPSASAPPTPTAATPTPQPTYVVQEGDTLAAIAQRFGTTVEALQAANGIDDPNTINIGQVLVIP